ncbi:MAG: PilZ domain-containing protein [Thermoanaerobaculia bacterium]|jgi:hypothetical protein
MKSTKSERRIIQRIRFDSPLTAKIATNRVTLVDVSATGARVEHDFPLSSGKAVQLEFEFEGASMHIRCTVARCKLEKGDGVALYRSGLAFALDDPALADIRALIASVVTRDFAARKAHLKPKKG